MFSLTTFFKALPGIMVRLCITIFFLASSASIYAQPFSMSLGVYTGLTSTFTLDDGISNDSRYGAAYGVKFAPIGMNFGMDYEGFGFVISPGLVNVGQDFYVVNTAGGHDGKRQINLNYLNIPAGFKIHIIRLSFFKVSGVVSLSAAYLLDGEESISHTATKLKFPTEVYPILPENYIVQYDGVVVPEVNDYIISDKSDFKSFQLFAGAGFRSDWDINNHWRMTFDFRVNYGLYDPRTDEYVAKVNAYQTLYDMPGERRDLFLQLSLGIARYIDIEKSDQERKKKLKGSSKKYKEKRYPYPKPRNTKPKG